MYKQFLFTAISLFLIISLAACSNYNDSNIIDNISEPTESSETEDPFENIENSHVFFGAIGHGQANPVFADDQSRIPIEYNGGEITLEYCFNSEGNLGGVGFLLFLDGVPQAYKIDDAQAEYEYCHTFPVEDKTDMTFSFIFTPCVGDEGDTLNLTVLSITNPDFQPDMEKSSSYGWYHKALPYDVSLYFNVDADTVEYPGPEDMFRLVSVSEEKITASFLENELAENGWGDVTFNTLNDRVYYTISYDESLLYDHLDVSEKETVSVKFELCGTAGENFRVSFWANHQPICDDALLSYNASTTKGNVVVVEAIIDTSKLADFTTFYVVAIPLGDTGNSAYKTNSILLYKAA